MSEVVEILMSQSGVSLTLLGILVIGLVFVLQWIWRRTFPANTQSDRNTESMESVVSARPVMSTEEASLFNMMKLAVQDYYFVLAKVPMLSVVSIVDDDEEARKAVMRRIQHVRLDMVLLHPGTLKAQTVIKFEKSSEPLAGVEERDRLVDTLLKAAGIAAIVLDLDQTYSVDRLNVLVGLAEEEEE